MKVALYGFKLATPNGHKVGITDFVEFLSKKDGVALDEILIAATPMQRDDGREWVAGVIIRNRQSRKTLLKEASPQKVVIKAQDLKKGQTVVDLNFFIFNPEKGRGLLHHHHHSIDIAGFAQILRTLYRKCSDFKAGEEVGNGTTMDPDSFHRAMQIYSGDLDVSALVTIEGHKQALARFKRITQIEFGMEVVSYSEEGMNALSKYAKGQRHKMTFSKKVDPKAVIEAAEKSFANGMFFKTLKATGLIEGDVKDSISLNDFTEKLGEADYDEWISDLELDYSDLSETLKKASPIQRLMKYSQTRRISALLT